MRVTGIENALVEFGERNYRQSDVRAEILNAGNDFAVTVEVMDHPIGIDQIAHQSDTGRWAGGDKPIRIYVRD